MIGVENFLHTTHRTVSWFRKAFAANELELSAPFQRNPVWSTNQKAYLVDTILNGLPIPELYMHEIGDEKGHEKHVVVDGQQRIRAVLEFIQGEFELDGDEVSKAWRGSDFDSLDDELKKRFFSYKFVVRVLPEMDEDGVRKIFARLNRNVVALNDQELRNATYWGPFIKTIQKISDDDPFWADCGVFSANDHRRMLDHEFISELAIAYLYGPQNKKDRLDQYYRDNEVSFDQEHELVDAFRDISNEIDLIIPDLANTRWRKKSDFYTLYILMAEKRDQFPLDKSEREALAGYLREFGSLVDRVLKLDDDKWEGQNPHVTKYARNVSRAASDRSSRTSRHEALSDYLASVGSQGTLIS